ncbi:MAG: 30S ribosomal protein S16 [Bacteroidota bacterium]
MVKLRLRREGKKGHAIYKVVAADERSPRDGAFLEIVGQYDPNLRPARITFKETRVEHWLRKGAQPTDTVRSLLRRTGLWLRWTLTRQGKDEATVARVTERWQLQQADRQTRDSDRKARRADRKKKAAQPAEAPAAPAAS